MLLNILLLKLLSVASVFLPKSFLLTILELYTIQLLMSSNFVIWNLLDVRLRAYFF